MLCDGADGIVGNADDDKSTYTTTLIDSDTDGVIESITVDLSSTGKGILNVVGTDSLAKNGYD